MMSFLGTPSFNSCLFESSNLLATAFASTPFCRSFFIPGRFEWANIQVINPGNHFAMAMVKTSDREALPKDA